mgnify:CR=1 FL=1
MTEFETNKILVSGTGKMGLPLMVGIEKDDRYNLLPFAISEDSGNTKNVGHRDITLIRSSERSEILPVIWHKYGSYIVLDVVPKTASQANIDFFSGLENMPLIAMSSGIEDQSKSRNTLFLANACLQIMAWEKFIAELDENSFNENYSLEVVESHQKSKIDVSGTALKMTPKIRRLGIKFDDANIVSLRSEEDYSRIGIPMDFWGAHAFHKYTISSDIEQDMRLRIFFSVAEDFFSENSLFNNLGYHEEIYGRLSSSEYNDKTLLWGSQFVDMLGYRTFEFGIHLVETKKETKVEVFHTILGHEPYVKGALNHAIPFMQEKCRNGLTGENFSSLQLYDWVMNR